MDSSLKDLFDLTMFWRS